MIGYADLWKLPLPLIIAIGIFKSSGFQLACTSIKTDPALLTAFGDFHSPPVATPQSDIMAQDKSLD